MPDEGDALLAAVADDPADLNRWLVLADWLDERGTPEHAGRAELMRLHVRLRACEPGTDTPEARRDEARVRALLEGGVLPCVPRFVNSAGMTFHQIPPGSFLMGSSPGEDGHTDGERGHLVTITRPFWLSATPVTQAQYQRVTGRNPSRFKEVAGCRTADFPVECVEWDAAEAFCGLLGARAEERGRAYRLPAEAEWEYAVRGSVPFAQPFYLGASISSRQANFDGNYPHGGGAEGPDLHRPCEVGSYPPNVWGLFDLAGNVLEWCADRWGPYPDGPQVDPRGPDNGNEQRVVRGGSWYWNGIHCRSAYRSCFYPSGLSTGTLGFRVACTLADRA